ncbi:MAG: flagellar basal body L-ring protein FlgH [Gemmatimonadota bacterium]|nr:flagellar basal body L-ring protein FlgH [Gemmatimonadota bacterium]
MSDRRALVVGQIVTILIDEQTLASADKEQTAVRDRSRDVGVAVNGSGGGLRTDNDVSDRQRGESSRRDRFVAEITARVAEIGPGDALRIEGLKRVQIDDHEQAVTIRGWIRSSDISPRNTVESWRIADAEILYDSNDELGKAGGFWSKLLDLIIP